MTSSGRLASALNSPRIVGLDALRALAVMLVLVNHSGVSDVAGLTFFNGGVGVEIFFVLSGFLITWLLLNELNRSGGIALMGFYRRRIARLMPAFYAYVLLGLLVSTLRSQPIPWEAVGASMLYVLNYHQGLNGAETHFLSHCWSLAVEEQFYFLWPFLLLALFLRRQNMVRFLLCTVLGIWVLRPVLFLFFDVPDAYVYRALETRADHLAVGCLLAVLLRQVRWQFLFDHLPKQWLLMLLLGLGLLLSSTAQRHMAYKYTLGYAIEPLLIAGLIPLVILAAQGQGWFARLLNAPLVVQMGEASYGMYLIHPLLMHPVRKGVEALTGSFALGVLVSIGAVTLLAFWSFKYFETPMRRRLAGHLPPVRPLPSA